MQSNQLMEAITFLGRSKPVRRMKIFVENKNKGRRIENTGWLLNKKRFMFPVRDATPASPLSPAILPFWISFWLKLFPISIISASLKNSVFFNPRFIRLVRIFSLVLLFACLGIPEAFAWVNGNFETCNLTGWTTSTNSGPNLACGPPTATSTTVGWAPLSNNLLPRVHGGNCAAQLYSARGDTNHVDWARIEQTDVVPTNG